MKGREGVVMKGGKSQVQQLQDLKWTEWERHLNTSCVSRTSPGFLVNSDFSSPNQPK